MKKTLLILSLFVFSFSNGQIAITALNGQLGSNGNASGDGLNYRSYERYESVSSFVQTSGAAQEWDISGLTGSMANASYNNSVPTAAEISMYPGSTMLSTCTNPFTGVTISKSYSSSPSAIFGFSNSEFTLNYSTNPIDLGTFPKTYGATSSDIVAGTYVFGDYTGTFTGTFNTSVDASGTMIFNPSESFEVIRLKTVETLEIIYPGLGNVGSFVQTTYSYYRALDLWPYVKSTNRVIVIPALNIDSNVTQIEKANAAFLSVPSVSIDKSISVFPNPATNTISVTLNNSQKLISLTVTDQLGKTILTKKESTTLDVSGLQKGVYFMTIVTDAGSSVKKFVKN